MFAVGLFGRIFRIICAIITLIFGGIDAALSSTETSQIWTLALLALVFSIVSAAMSKTKPKLAG